LIHGVEAVHVGLAVGILIVGHDCYGLDSSWTDVK
jgi:hypothetical protein